METQILVILAALLLSAFFSGMEIAFFTSNKLRLEVERKQSRSYNYIANLFLRSPGGYISTILVGNNIALVIYSIFMSQLYFSIFGSENYAFETIISTMIIIFAAEFLPKAVVKSNPNFYLRIFAIPLYSFYILFYPISRITTLISNMILRMMGYRVKRDATLSIFGKDDLAFLVEETDVGAGAASADAEGAPGDSQHVRLFQNALDFSEQRVRECMVPRTEIEAIDIEASVEQLSQRFISTGYSRLLVFEGSVDNIVGYASLKSLFNNPESIRQITKAAIYAPESMSLQMLLQQIIKSHTSIAIVIDEFGSTAGMVTIEDILEQIFGEIEDEHDSDDLVERETAPGVYVMAGRLEIDYLNERYGIGLPESDRYETLAGYILSQVEDFPKNGEIITANGIRIKILRTSSARIELVELSKVQ